MDKGRRNNSLRKNSIKMVANILKLSSFSIAKMSLGAVAQQPAPKSVPSLAGSTSVVTPQFSGSLRSQEPQNASKPVSYLVEPVEGNGSLHLLREEKNVDGMASEYIRKVHEKNRSLLFETPKLSQFIIPPPPQAAM